MDQALTWLRTPVGRGFALIALTTACTGFAMAAHQNIVSNYFEQLLHLNGPQFGYITAIREIPGFLLIFLTAIFYRLSLPAADGAGAGRCWRSATASSASPPRSGRSRRGSSSARWATTPGSRRSTRSA